MRRRRLGLGHRTNLVASGFMNGSRDLACEHIRTAPGFEHAGVAVVLSGAIADRPVLRDALARRGERAAIFSQLLISGTDIEVAFGIECEVGSREKLPSVRSDLSIRFTCGSIPRSSTSQPLTNNRPVWPTRPRRLCPASRESPLPRLRPHGRRRATNSRACR
jgi:hypothetical protein